MWLVVKTKIIFFFVIRKRKKPTRQKPSSYVSGCVFIGGEAGGQVGFAGASCLAIVFQIARQLAPASPAGSEDSLALLEFPPCNFTSATYGSYAANRDSFRI